MYKRQEESDAYEKTMAMIKAMENNDLYFKRINIDGNDVQAYVYDTLICLSLIHI